MKELSATAIRFNDADHSVFECLEHQLSEAILIGNVESGLTEDDIDFLMILDVHCAPLWTVEKHGEDIYLIYSAIGEHAMAVHGSAHAASDAIIEMVTFPRNP